MQKFNFQDECHVFYQENNSLQVQIQLFADFKLNFFLHLALSSGQGLFMEMREKISRFKGCLCILREAYVY